MKSSSLPLQVMIDDTPFHSGNRYRGVGVYTRLLTRAIDDHQEVNLVSDTQSAELIHYPHFDLFTASLPLGKKRPTVVTIHDVIPLVFSEAYPSGVKGKVNFFRQRLALGNVKAIITDSQASAADINRYLKIKPHRIFIIPLAADPELQPLSSKLSSTLKRKHGIPSQYILYVGDINYNKNLPQLIKALKYLPWQIKLVLIGKNMREQKIPEWQAIQTQIALSDVAKRVVFVADLESDRPSDLASIYANAICYVQPSLYEGFGLPVLEALQAGTPVVSSHTSSLPEIIGEAGLLVEPTAEGIGVAVKQVLSLSNRDRLSMIARGKARARHFTWHRVADQTVSVYKQVLNVQK